MGQFLASLWGAANMLVTNRFRQTPGIEAAPVVDRKNARVCIVDKLSGFTMPMFKGVMEHAATRLRSTKKQNSLESPKQSLSSDWRRRVPPAGTSSFNRSRFVAATFIHDFDWVGSFCLVGFEPLPCPPAKGAFSIPVDFLRACVPDDFTHIDFSGPCAYVPFLSWPHLAPGRDGCFVKNISAVMTMFAIRRTSCGAPDDGKLIF